MRTATSSAKIQRIIEAFGLQPHPEGGFFKETYRAKQTISKAALAGNFSGDRSYSTGIYYLLVEGKRSSLHRIKSDEMWHFYLGGPLNLVQISPDGVVETITLGQEVHEGQKLQHVVPAGWWFGAYPDKGSGYSFVGCTVAPGFDFSDFEMGRRADLLRMFPQAKEVVEKLTDGA
jgi:uncharacterized protein